MRTAVHRDNPSKVNGYIREIMEKQGVGNAKLADRVGISAQAMSNRLSQNNISIDRLVEMLKVLDYKVVLVPSETRMKDGWYEV